jgi:general secretion pathway protein A
MSRIDPARLNPIKIVSTAIEADDLLRTVATGLNVAGEGKSKAELLSLIERGLHAVARTGRRTLLIVDEAQALPVSALEELRMLSNFQAGGRAMLQIFLLGQPEFRDRLNGSNRLEQLRQRVIALHHLDPMGEAEVETYVARRLQVAGWTGRPDFADDVFPLIFTATDGVPRRLNQLMGRVLLHAALSGTELIDAALVQSVIDDAARDVRTPAPVAAEPVAPEPVITPAPATDAALVARVASLEARLEEQDAALRRVLTLLVDWVEGEGAWAEGRADALREVA